MKTQQLTCCDQNVQETNGFHIFQTGGLTFTFHQQHADLQFWKHIEIEISFNILQHYGFFLQKAEDRYIMIYADI